MFNTNFGTKLTFFRALCIERVKSRTNHPTLTPKKAFVVNIWNAKLKNADEEERNMYYSGVVEVTPENSEEQIRTIIYLREFGKESPGL